MNFDPKRLLSLMAHKPSTDLPAIGGPIDMPMSASARESIRAPIVVGVVIIGLFVVGFGTWAAFAPLWGAVTVPGVVRVENNRKTLKSRDGGIIRQINVREGDAVKPGQLLIKFDDTVARAQVAIFENQYDTVAVQAARLQLRQ